MCIQSHVDRCDSGESAAVTRSYKQTQEGACKSLITLTLQAHVSDWYHTCYGHAVYTLAVIALSTST